MCLLCGGLISVFVVSNCSVMKPFQHDQITFRSNQNYTEYSSLSKIKYRFSVFHTLLFVMTRMKVSLSIRYLSILKKALKSVDRYILFYLVWKTTFDGFYCFEISRCSYLFNNRIADNQGLHLYSVKTELLSASSYVFGQRF